ncbi:hypothetical protein [Nostoc sp. PCC 7107]|uniref:hypothetical protein n=1 Tax=Nostoc sp. PCC 7107 TaxID=317936 RepID=UPI00029ECA8B|nr:hypothetical protein [Nostoc sp. PCC 7107]AFY42730.1 hypothetical protein Nos7107_2108 [Nostoc sp. PCC 7107]
MNHKLFYYEFEIKYYQWRLKEAEKEYETAFERLSGMKSYFAREIVEVISRFSQKEQSKILPILIKKSEGEFLNNLSIKITDEEEVIFNNFYVKTKNEDLRKILSEQNKRLKKYSKRFLRKVIINALDEILQPKFYADICFDQQISKNWKISTFVIIDNNSSYYYSHIITKLNEDNTETRIGPFTINLSTWLGLYPSGWVFENEQDVYKSANTIALLCKYFIDSFQEWNID